MNCELLSFLLVSVSWNNSLLSSPENAPNAFGIPLSQAIANDQAYKRRQDALKESRRDCLDLEASILRFRAEKRQFFNGNKPLGSSSSITGPGSPSANSVAPAPVFDAQSKPTSPTFLDNTSRGQRRVRWIFLNFSNREGVHMDLQFS
ncbi:hypothetical protein ILYODFUR_028799 [Ilyodon furcidens]|uniref:Uncharacterized protein n=1 Tax=Ilyodon furcidens TaxID=33524 RepID=A0ABV0TMH5_9TELE